MPDYFIDCDQIFSWMAFQKASKGYTPISGKGGGVLHMDLLWQGKCSLRRACSGFSRGPQRKEKAQTFIFSLRRKVTIQSHLSVCRRVVWSCSGQFRFLQKQKQQHAQRGSASVKKNSKGELPFQAWLGSEVFTCKPAGPNSKSHIWSIGLVPNLTFIKISKQS